MKVDDMSRLERTERMMVRWMCGESLKDGKSRVVLLERLSVKEVSEVVRGGRLRWYAHLQRKDASDWVFLTISPVFCGRGPYIVAGCCFLSGQVLTLGKWF